MPCLIRSLVCLPIALLTATAHGAIYQQNFDSFANGAAVTTDPAITVAAANGTTKIVAASQTTPNKNGAASMRVFDNDASDGGGVSANVTFAPITTGTVELKLWIATPPPVGGEFQVRLSGQQTGGSQVEAARLFIRTDANGTSLRVRQGTGTASNNTDVTLISAVSLNTAYAIEFSADAATDSYSISVNGGAQQSGKFVNNRLLDNVSQINLLFGGAGATIRDGEYFFDDIAVAVPEPASLALIGLGGLLILSRNRR